LRKRFAATSLNPPKSSQSCLTYFGVSLAFK
jgi:hypothetical protein